MRDEGDQSSLTVSPAPSFHPILQRSHTLTRLQAGSILLVAAFCWGSGNVANKTVLEHLGPLTVVGLRCLLAAAVIAPFALRERPRRVDIAWLQSTVGVALLFATALVLQQMAYLSTSVTNASFLVNTATILTPMVAWAALGHQPTVLIACAAPVTLVGAFLMAGAGFSPSSMKEGDLACFGSALAYAGWMVALGQHAVKYGRPVATTLLQFGVTAALILPVGILTEAPALRSIGAAFPELLMLGVVSTALAFGLMTWAQRYVAASTAAIIVSAESLFGAAAGYLLLGERTPVIGLTGAALILAAILIVAVAGKATQPTPGTAAARPEFKSTRKLCPPAIRPEAGGSPSVPQPTVSVSRRALS